MGERISPTTTTTDQAVDRGRTSINNVVSVVTDPHLFPWIDRYAITGFNSACDQNQIDLILYTGECFTNLTELDTVCAQVKSAEYDMTWFQGVIGHNGKINTAKFLHHTHRQWVAASLTYLNGQWPSDLIASDFMYQVCAMSGHWRDIEDTLNFAGFCFPPDGINLMKRNLHLIKDFRGRFLDWVALGARELEVKPL